MSMYQSDRLRFAWSAVIAQPLRTALILLSMSIGVASVTVLTSLGESARLYIINQFQALGTNLVIVMPGRNETTGGQPPIFGETPRDLTLQDAEALLHSRYVKAVAPVMVGSAPVSTGGLERETDIIGSTAALRTVRHLSLAKGRFLPVSEFDKASPVCVIGTIIADDLFPGKSALGNWLRINDQRFRVIGILSKEGQSISVNFDEIIIIPVASAQSLFDRNSLFRILLESTSKTAMIEAMQDIRTIIKQRHEGEDDITIITQDSVTNTFDEILKALTLTVSGIAAISLCLAGVLVMNVMLVSVSQRTGEIGLLKAIGATPAQIRHLFIYEAAILSCSGAIIGFLLGQCFTLILQWYFPDFKLVLPLWALASALFIALATGLIFGILPAVKAANLNPIKALSKR